MFVGKMLISSFCKYSSLPLPLPKPALVSMHTKISTTRPPNTLLPSPKPHTHPYSVYHPHGSSKKEDNMSTSMLSRLSSQRHATPISWFHLPYYIARCCSTLAFQIKWYMPSFFTTITQLCVIKLS